MCHLDSLKMLRKPLPAKGKFANIWQKVYQLDIFFYLLFILLKITKIVDDLHIRNHSPECREIWNPSKVKASHPDVNLMVLKYINSH